MGQFLVKLPCCCDPVRDSDRDGLITNRFAVAGAPLVDAILVDLKIVVCVSITSSWAVSERVASNQPQHHLTVMLEDGREVCWKWSGDGSYLGKSP